MSQAHIEKFHAIAANDQALLIQLIGDGSSPEQFIENAVNAAKERGLDFSTEEANAWVTEQQAAKASGELSDTQLEGVAGGKSTPVWDAMNSASNAMSSGFNSASGAITKPIMGAARPVLDFINGW